MINRRHIRIKVMQSAYATILSENDTLNKQEKFLLESVDKLHQLYALQFKLLIALHQKATEYFEASGKKYIPSGAIEETSPNFVQNSVLAQLKSSLSIQNFVFKKMKRNGKIIPK